MRCYYCDENKNEKNFSKKNKVKILKNQDSNILVPTIGEIPVYLERISNAKIAQNVCNECVRKNNEEHQKTTEANRKKKEFFYELNTEEQIESLKKKIKIESKKHEELQNNVQKIGNEIQKFVIEEVRLESNFDV